MRDALSGARPTTERSTPLRPATRTTYGRTSTADRASDPVVDLRRASSPQPQRVRFPRSYNEGQRERRVAEKKAEALDRDRLYAARIAGRNAEARAKSDAAREDRKARSRTRSESAIDRKLTARSRKATPDNPRLSELRVTEADQARTKRADRASAARRSAKEAERKNQKAKDARAAHRAKAAEDSVYARKVAAEAKAAQAATEIALNTGLTLGVTLAGGWSAGFESYDANYYDDCGYRPTWCTYPTYYGCSSRWIWSACWWWYRPCYPCYQPIYAGWWNPWCNAYYGSSYVTTTEVVYVQEEVLPAEEEVVPAGQLERAPGADSEALRRSAGRYLQLGDDAFQLGQYARAVHYYAKAIELSPDDGVLYLVLSDALFATGDYHYAAYALRRAFELEPDLVLMEFDKRDLYSDPAEFDQQLGQLELYLDDHFLDEDARLLLTTTYLFSGSAGLALDLLEDPFSVEVSESELGALLYDAALIAYEREQDGK